MEVIHKKAEAVESRKQASLLIRSAPWLLLSFFTLVYFGRTLLRASAKPFWYDEICTLYIARLSTFAQSWAAEMHGADYNPPLFYLIHRAAIALFGDSQLALRLPEIFSFWLFCICLFRFVGKRAGLAAGWIAMVLPMLTGAYYYATEARPHGLILGFLGLAMVFWQELQEKPHRWGWRIGFLVSIGLAYFSHCYAVLLAIPFGLAELWQTIRTRQIRLREWITLIVPPVAAAISFIPLLRSYRRMLQGSGFGALFAPTLSAIPDFYSFVLAPCWFIVLAAAVLYLVDLHRREKIRHDVAGRPSHPELALSLALSALPVFGTALAFVMHGPVLLRYMLGATAGCVLLVTYACLSQSFRRAATYVAILTGLLIAWQFTRTARLRYKGIAEFMVEPSSGLFFSRNPSDPMEPYLLLRNDPHPDQPLVVASVIDFLYLVHYAPEWRARLYPVTRTKDETMYKLHKAVREWCNIHYNREQSLNEFLPTHGDFEFYGNHYDFGLLAAITKHRGATITSFQWGDNRHFLAQVHVPTQ